MPNSLSIHPKFFGIISWVQLNMGLFLSFAAIIRPLNLLFLKESYFRFGRIRIYEVVSVKIILKA